MGLFHKRPLALAALLFMLSGALAFFCNVNLLFLGGVALIFTVLIAAALTYNKRQAVPILLLTFVMVCGGFLRSYLYKADFDRVLSEHADGTSEVEMTVKSVQYALSFGSSYEVTITKIDGQSVNLDAIFETSYDGGLTLGSAIRAYVNLSDFAENEDGFGEKAYYNSKGIFLKATEADEQEFELLIENSTVDRLEIKARQLRNKLSALIDKYLPENNGLPAAVFLGDRSALGETDKMNFRRTGTYHLLALSGMHLSVLAGMLDFLLRSLSIKKNKRLLINTAVILFYVVLTGLALSVVRAAIMLFMSYFAYYVRREKDSLTSLLLAGAGICAVSPCAISDVGFILSFSTTFGILAFYPAIESRIIRARSVKLVGQAFYYVLSSLGISAVALLFALPVSWLYFGKVAVLSPVGTLLLSPLISALMLLTPLTMLLGSVPIAGTAIGRLTVLVSKSASYIASLLAKPSRIELSLNYPFTPFFLVPFFALILVIIFFKLRHLKYFFISAFSVMLCFCIFHSVYLQTTPISASFLCYGENEYAIVSKYGQNLLIDLSDGSYGKMSLAATTATSSGYCRIDALILTHYHNRHVSSVSRLIKNYPVGQIILSEPIDEKEAQIALSIIEVADSAGIEARVFSLESGFTLFGETEISLDRDYITASTHPILALDLVGEVDISYFGSSYAAWWEVTTARENVIFGTHGPVAKKEFFVPFSDDTKLISFADRSMAELMSKDCPRPPVSCKILLTTTLIKIK